MKKKFFLCLIEIVSLTCMGHAVWGTERNVY